MLLVIDNFDSFTYNLVQYFGELGVPQRVFRNNEIDVDGAAALKPERVVISPGPCDPDRAGISMQIIQHFAGKVPILGVCLGHQCIGQVYGGKITRASRLMHGKTSAVTHQGSDLFTDLPQSFKATRYHSLVVDKATLPPCLHITAETEDDGEIMGLRHKELPVYGVQFHPESYATEHGMALLKNFLKL
jgi:anthranilate synthase/aminodeoxychorismate synthase-like glutamine amidotransferase